MAVDITSAHITASGNISASGYVQAEHFKADIGTGYTIAGTPVLYANAGEGLLGGITFVSNEFVNRTKILGNNIELNGVVTASSHISSSGTVSAKSFLLNGTPVGSSTDTFWETGSVAGSIYYVAGPIAVAALTATTITSSGAAKFATVNTGQGDNELYDMNQNVKTTSNVQFNHITASGNISASGIITADTLTSNNIVFTPGATSIKIEAPDETTGNIKGADLTIESGNGFGSNQNGGNITFQTGKGSGAGDGGNIILQAGGGLPSGSITISSNNLNIDNIGNITASGNISVGNGTSTLPAISFAADSNTGIYRPAPDNLSLQVGGGTVELNIGAARAQLSTNLYLSSAESGNITASGDISASGDYIGNNATFNNIRNNGLTNGRITFAGTNGVLQDDADLTFLSDTLTVTKIANVNSSTHITASSNISASGTIIGSNLSGTNTGDDLRDLAVEGTNVIFTDVTATGNVGSTGTITAGGGFIGDGSQLTNMGQQTANDFTDADHDKLDGIETSADVTDATNVEAAGALMDNELTNIAAIKAINQSLITTADVTFDDIVATGQVIATENISTSANINASGHITASGNISGSFTSTGSFGRVEASGNISASNITVSSANIEGDLVGKDIGNGSSNISGFDNLSIYGNATLGNNGSESHTLHGSTTLKGNAGELVLSELPVSASSFIAQTHITASGNISASNITVSSANIEGDLVGKDIGNGTSNISGFDSLQIYGNATLGNNTNDSHTLNGRTTLKGTSPSTGVVFIDGPGGHITASGDISASGTVTANSFLGDGSGLTNVSQNFTNYYISASGDISASIGDLSIQGDIFLSGSGVPTITSDNNLILSASNGAVVIKDKLQLNPTGTGSVASPINGDMVYDSADHKFYGYANGAWVAFH